MDAPLISSLPRQNCLTCRQPTLFAPQVFKNCADCREKNRQKSRRASERKRTQKQDEQTMLAQGANLPDSDSDTNAVVQERQTSTGATKRKTPLATQDFNVDIGHKRAKGFLMKSEPRGRVLPSVPFVSC